MPRHRVYANEVSAYDPPQLYKAQGFELCPPLWAYRVVWKAYTKKTRPVQRPLDVDEELQLEQHALRGMNEGQGCHAVTVRW